MPEKNPQDLQCVMLKHRCPKVPLLCPHVLSMTLVPSPALPDQLWLSHLRKCSWDKIADFPTLVPPADLQPSKRGGMNECEGKRAGPGASVVGPSLGVSSAGGAGRGLLCSCCFSTPGSRVQHHLYTDSLVFR